MANPLQDARFEYDHIGTNVRAVLNDYALPVQKFKLGSCTFAYTITVGEVDAVRSNHAPAPLRNIRGEEFVYAKTRVRLEDGVDNTSRFLLVLKYPYPADLHVSYFVFDKGEHTPDHLRYTSTAAYIGQDNDSASFVITIPQLDGDPQFAELFIIPHARAEDGEPLALARAGLSIPKFGRLVATSFYETRSPVYSEVPAEPWTGRDFPPGTNVIRAEPDSILPALAAMAVPLGEPENAFDAASRASFLIERVVAPSAKAKLLRSHTPVGPPSLLSEVATAVKHTRGTEEISITRTIYGSPGGEEWLVTRNARQWSPSVSGAHSSKLVTTMTVTELSAGGVRVIERTFQGETAAATMEAARSTLAARSHAPDPARQSGERGALRSSQSFALSASAVEVGWNLHKAAQATDPFARIEYENAAVRSGILGLAALTPQGAVADAVWLLAAWGGEKIGGPVVGNAFDETEDWLMSVFLGRVDPDDARQAFRELETVILQISMDYEAPLLTPQTVKETPSPSMFIVIAMCCAVALCRRRRRGDQRF